MWPRYRDKDYTLICRWPGMRVRVGDVAVFRHFELGKIIKRVIQVDSGGRCLLAGENSSSTDSESIGWLPPSSLMGKVIWHFAADR